MSEMTPILKVEHLTKLFPVKKQKLFEKQRYVHAVEDVSFEVYPGEVLGIVGESGSGKSTLARAILALTPVTSGKVFYEGKQITNFQVSHAEKHQLRSAMQMIFQDPYMFYFSGTDVEVAGASPETLVKLENGILHTFPLAGTRRRGKTDEEDRALEAELLADEKELAEHNMLVDLGRNDLGKISRFGTVQVERLHSIERFSHVMHIGSTVRGEIRAESDALDAIEAVLPAGTLSGAPKIRACQLIGRLENNKRGVYGGAIGYIDFAGNMDTCIAIRIAYKKNGKVFVRSGAGIVADSVPEKEFEECINKAKAVVNALKLAQEVDV